MSFMFQYENRQGFAKKTQQLAELVVALHKASPTSGNKIVKSATQSTRKARDWCHATLATLVIAMQNLQILRL